jgi:Bacterial archaeo-eukaryotic release factor family 2
MFAGVLRTEAWTRTSLSPEHAVLHSQPAVGRRGRGVITAADHVLVNEHLISPPSATVLRVSDYPYILPLVELGMQRRPTYVFAAVDHVGADITLHRGEIVTSETVDGGGYPVNKPVSAGWNGYGDFQHSTEEAIRMNERAVVDRLTELVDETDPEVVFVCGEVRGRTDVVSALPGRVAARVCQLHAGALGARIGEDEVSDLIDAEFERRRGAETAAIAERFQTEIGRRSGLAAEGLAAVCAALRAGDVDTLIVGDLGDATLVTGEELTTIAPDADALSELGEAPVRVVRADETLPFVAITVGASVIRADDRIAPTDGIGALLRYAAAAALPNEGAPSRPVAP